MDVPLHYQVSEYDCVPTTFLNAVSFLFTRREIPPLVVRHIYTYSLDTVSRGGRLGRAGTSKYAIQLLGHWLNAYKTRKFSVATAYLAPEEIHLRDGSQILQCLAENGVALCNIYVGQSEWHFVLALGHDDEWLYVFDPYLRRALRGLGNRARLLDDAGGYRPNIAIRRDWMDGPTRQRFGLGEEDDRECLLVWRVR